MRNYQDKFPSRFLKADDLNGRRRLLTIKEITEESIGAGSEAEDKLVAFFRDEPKGLVLNRTNCSLIAEIAGSEDLDTWPGHRVVLYPTKVDFKGKRVPAIRIEEPPAGAAPPERVSADTQLFAKELEDGPEGEAS